MKKYIIYIMAILFLMASELCIAQGDLLYFQKIRDASGNEQLLGTCSRMCLLEKPFATWFQPNYNGYVVDSGTCRFVEPLVKNKTITIFMGTWCGDSRREEIGRASWRERVCLAV